MPVAELGLGVPAVVGRPRPYPPRRGLRLLAGAGVTEHLGSVERDYDAVVEGLFEVGLDLVTAQQLGQLTSLLGIAEVSPQAPVVVHALCRLVGLAGERREVLWGRDMANTTERREPSTDAADSRGPRLDRLLEQF